MTPDELAELLAEMDVDPDLLANLEDDDIEDLACMWALCGTTVTVRLTNGRTFRGMLLKVTPVNLVVSSRCIEYPSWYEVAEVQTMIGSYRMGQRSGCL